MTAHVSFNKSLPMKVQTSVCINEYLDIDTLYYIFEILAQKPSQSYVCAQVCKYWKDITKKDGLWKEVSKKIKIVKEPAACLKDKITQVLFDSKSAITVVSKEKLLTCQATRGWVFTALQHRILNAMENDERDKLAQKIEAMLNERNERMKKLRAAFEGYLLFTVMGCNTLFKAKEVAEILASDKYLEKEPLQAFQKFWKALKHEGRLPICS
jgi:hypothetical protein